MAYAFLSKYTSQEKPKAATLPEGNGILIFKSELDYISRCILDRKNIETGGQLFGYWSEDGRPVVMYAIGPGPRANHQQTFFNQDIDYLVSVGRALKDYYGLHHIGEWHSHHQLGLARPSSHDVHTMVSTIRDKELGKFLLCIGNCTSKASSLKGYMCDSSSCSQKEWDVIYSESPVRRDADYRLKGILRHPKTEEANHADSSLNTSAAAPKYAEGYWLKKPGSGAILNDIMNYLKRKHPRSDVRAQMNQQGEVVLKVCDFRGERQIRFPRGFPERAPDIMSSRHGKRALVSNPIYWQYMRDNITGSFIHFYEIF